MKLPNPFTRDTASMLQKAIAERDAAEAKLAELHKQRAAVLLDAELTEVEAIDKQIEAAHHAAGILADRILALDARLHAEEAAERERRYAADIATIERLLPLRNDAAGEVEKAMLAVAAAVRKYSELTESITTAKWPPGVARPTYHLSLRPLGERLRNAFGHPSLIFRQTLQPLPSGDLVKRVCDADSRIAGFADGEAKGHEELLIELRNRGVAPVAEIDEERAA
jgi:multidrug efflux pump subunit AcrA (membrane-fusion protein)